jgi:thiol-disulfide isomerase/thioredoxin
MKKILQGFSFFILSVSIAIIGNTQEVRSNNDTESNTPEQIRPALDLFYGAECPHCHTEMAWLPELKQLYPDVLINKYEVWHDAENKNLLDKRLLELKKTTTGVPTNIIGTDVLVGFNKEKILTVLEKYYGEPTGKNNNTNNKNTTQKSEDISTTNNKKLGFIIGGVLLIAIIGGFMIFGKNEK